MSKIGNPCLIPELKLSERDLVRLSLFERAAMEQHQHSVFSLENDTIDKKIQTTAERYRNLMSRITIMQYKSGRIKVLMTETIAS